MDCILLQDAPELVRVNAGLIQDRLCQAWAENLARMDRHCHSAAPLRVSKLDVGAPLHDNEPAEALERSDEFCAGETRHTRHDAES
jgi:hypothetical protein